MTSDEIQPQALAQATLTDTWERKCDQGRATRPSIVMGAFARKGEGVRFPTRADIFYFRFVPLRSSSVDVKRTTLEKDGARDRQCRFGASFRERFLLAPPVFIRWLLSKFPISSIR